MTIGGIIVKIIPFIIPAVLLGSLLVNTRTKSDGNKTKKSEPAPENKVSDRDMTST